MKGGIYFGDAKTGQPIAKVCSPVTYKDSLPDRCQPNTTANFGLGFRVELGFRV